MLWKIPVTWEMCACIEVEADTLEEAMKVAEDPDGKIPLPSDGSYVDGSWVLSSTDRDEIAILQKPVQAAGNDNNGHMQPTQTPQRRDCT